MAEQIGRVNWVRCPKCNYRYYVGPQLLVMDDALAECPKCQYEFDPKPHLESKITGVSVGERWV